MYWLINNMKSILLLIIYKKNIIGKFENDIFIFATVSFLTFYIRMLKGIEGNKAFPKMPRPLGNWGNWWVYFILFQKLQILGSIATSRKKLLKEIKLTSPYLMLWPQIANRGFHLMTIGLTTNKIIGLKMNFLNCLGIFRNSWAIAEILMYKTAHNLMWIGIGGQGWNLLLGKNECFFILSVVWKLA